MRKSVLVFGVWDLLHVGHLRFLEEAKLGFGHSQLTVVVVPDSRVKTDKASRPIIPQADRMEMLKALWMVDHLILNPEKEATCSGVLELLKPAIYFKGREYEPTYRQVGNPTDDLSNVVVEEYPGAFGNRLKEETAVVVAYGGQVKLSRQERSHSTTDIIDQIHFAFGGGNDG